MGRDQARRGGARQDNSCGTFFFNFEGEADDGQADTASTLGFRGDTLLAHRLVCPLPSGALLLPSFRDTPAQTHNTTRTTVTDGGRVSPYLINSPCRWFLPVPPARSQLANRPVCVLSHADFRCAAPARNNEASITLDRPTSSTRACALKPGGPV